MIPAAQIVAYGALRPCISVLPESGCDCAARGADADASFRQSLKLFLDQGDPWIKDGRGVLLTDVFAAFVQQEKSAYGSGIADVPDSYGLQAHAGFVFPAEITPSVPGNVRERQAVNGGAGS